MAGFWNRLDTPAKVIGGVVATGAAIITTYIAVAGNPFASSAADQAAQTDPHAVAAHEVKRCMTEHQMHSPVGTVASGNYLAGNVVMIFRRCDWPPIADTSTDGYSQIVDRIAETNASNAAPFDEVDKLSAPCGRITVTYLLAQGGANDFVSRRLERGRIYLAVAPALGRLALKQLNQIPEGALKYIPPPSNAQLFLVLHSGHFAPYDATCARGT
jgi:hypothetical protein